MTLYKNVLHHSANRLPKWLLEAVGVYVSALNGCGYCVDHHAAGMRRLLQADGRDPDWVDAVETTVRSGKVAEVLSAQERAAFDYAHRLTRDVRELAEADVAALRAAGYDDGEILELNQVIAYFAFANRTVQGLGVDTDGDILGLSPGDSDDPENWSHA